MFFGAHLDHKKYCDHGGEQCTVRNPERQSAFIHADWNLERRIYPTWNSNLSSCTPSATPSLGGFNVYQGTNPQGTATVTPGISTYNFYVTCDPYDTNAGEITSTQPLR